MKRIYLDQNKWIELLEVGTGKTADPAIIDLFRVAEFGVRMGDLSFPLSIAHYMETSFRRDWESRRALAGLMGRLSKFHAIARRAAIIPAEVDAALERRFGRSAGLPEPQVFGYGALHAVYSGPGFFDGESDGGRGTLERIVAAHAPRSPMREAIERAVLAGPSPEEEPDMPEYQPLRAKALAEKDAETREALRILRKEAGWLRGERSKRLAIVETFKEEPEILRAMGAVEVSRGECLPGGRELLEALVADMPVVFATQELRRLRHSAVSNPLSDNDDRDLGFLGTAIVHCDIVVTEKQWAGLAKRSQLDEKYGTKVISDLRDLVALVV